MLRVSRRQDESADLACEKMRELDRRVILELAADGMWTNSAVFLLLALLSGLLLTWGVISREETYLARKFGDGYVQYRRSVRRWA